MVNSTLYEGSKNNKDSKYWIISSVVNDSKSVDWYEMTELGNKYRVKFKLATGAQYIMSCHIPWLKKQIWILSVSIDIIF